MADIEVTVFRGGKEVTRVKRPVRQLEGHPAVVYRKRLWRLVADREIHLDQVESRHRSSGGAGTRQSTSQPSNETGVLQSTKEENGDEEDRLAIRSAGAEARILVEAGPGTGKTELAAHRIASLVAGSLSPGQLLVLSFSRSAVRTLTQRLSRLNNCDDRVIEELRHVGIRTFDSWAFRMLRLMGKAPAELMRRTFDDNIADLTAMMRGKGRDEVRNRIGNRRHIIVDEFQDLPGVRAELVLALLDLMAPPGRSGCGFTVLGDPLQSIFSFAVEGQNFPKATEYWTRIVDTYGAGLQQRKLKRNYRAETNLASLTGDLRAVLLSNDTEEAKLKWVRKAIDSLPCTKLGPHYLAGNATGSRAILTRTNGEAIRVLQELVGQSSDAPIQTIRLHAGSYSLLPPAWIGALLKNLRASELTRTQFARIYAHLDGQWGDQTKRHLAMPSEVDAWARLAVASGAASDTTSIKIADLRTRLGWQDSFPDDQSIHDDGIVITTIHRSKGMEFDSVTILDSSSASVDEREAADQPAGEESNVGYVAMTRAAQSLSRVEAGEINRPPTRRTFESGRERLTHRRNGWCNIEMGLRGDVDPYGFVDPRLHGGDRKVEELQDFLLKNARELEGRKLMLCKNLVNDKAIWLVHLQEGTRPGKLIGRTAPQLTYDLLRLLHKEGVSLPKTIMNLRVAGVGTVVADGEFGLEEPFRSSKIWLGVSVFGTGDFKIWKPRNA